MASESRDADSATTSDAPYYYLRDFYTLSDKDSDSKNPTFLCKLCPPGLKKQVRFKLDADEADVRVACGAEASS